MFPVPSHLPRTGGEHLASPPNGVDETAKTEIGDQVLDLFEPLLGDAQAVDSGTVRQVKDGITKAVQSNKVCDYPGAGEALSDDQTLAHELLRSNFPSISSHIRAGTKITSDFKSIETNLTELEARIDPANSEVGLVRRRRGRSADITADIIHPTRPSFAGPALHRRQSTAPSTSARGGFAGVGEAN